MTVRANAIPAIAPAARQGGLTLIEMMVTIAIAMFLLAGVGYMLQNTRTAYQSQNQLQQLQDAERLAMSLIADVVQSTGYFPDPSQNTIDTAFPAAPPMVSEQSITGTLAGTTPGVPGDALTVRYVTSPGDGILNCLGTSNTSGANVTYTNTFSLSAPLANGTSNLQCALIDSSGTNTSTQALVGGLTDIQIWYGVKRNFATTDNNVDTYLRANEMQNPNANGNNDWADVTAVRIVLTFQNPLAQPTAPANQKTINFERVIAVMNRAGVGT
jgi:type IV pilus assembly protein PilW